MSNKISIFLIGIGGYGSTYVNELLDNYDEDRFYIAGVYDPKPDNCERIDEIREKGIKCYDSIDDFYANSHADLAVISSPIQYHCPQTVYALSHGSNVLCEKPVAASVDDAYMMADESKKYGKFTAVGYQWSFSDAVLELKKDIIAGVFGKAKRLSSLVLWPRDLKYYARGWAGRIKDPDGRLVLDSIANNAAAHYLHNMFFILGKDIDKSAYPQKVTAELYRANAIENFDTTAIRAQLIDDVQVYFFASHAVENSRGPLLKYEFEKATVLYDNDMKRGKGITAHFNDGSTKTYGDPFVNDMSKIWKCIDAVNKKGMITSPAISAIPHTICINGIRESMPDIVTLPQDITVRDDIGNRIYVNGLSEIMTKCFDEGILPNKAGIKWSKKGEVIDLKKYIRTDV